MPQPDGNAAPDHLIPSLAVAINTQSRLGAQQGNLKLTSSNITADELRHILREILSRLKIGLLDAWISAEGGGTPWDLGGPDEEWAQVVTEMLLYTAYGGPGGQYLGSADTRFFEQLVSDNPAYPIVAACQQLSTIGVLSRGFALSKPLDAASAEPVTGVGGRLETSPGQSVAKAVAKGLTPGSVFSTSDFRHIAFILRINQDRRRMQFFDTWAMAPPFPEPPKPKALSSHPCLQGGNYDYGWLDQVGKTCRHWGFLPPADPKQLKDSINKMLRARPLGMCRLVLRNKATQRLVFATPLLLMYGAAADDNFSIARHMWALRWMPGRDQLEGLFLIYIPQWALATEMLGAQRTVSLGEMIAQVQQSGSTASWNCITVLSTWPDIEVVGKGPNSTWRTKKTPADCTQGLTVIRHRRSYKDDPVSFNFYPPLPGDIYQLVNNLPWDKPSCSKGSAVTSLDWSGLEHFRGDWDGAAWNEV